MPKKISASESYCRGLAPVVGAHAHTLVLGSMLGKKSLELRQYYAHPQNAFWKIMGALFDAETKTYAARLSIIENNKLALWDTLKCCVRPGSLDADIDDASIEANDFAPFFKKYPAITRVFFNGTKSEQVFRRRVMPELSDAIKKRITFARLPSTSPAHAGRSFKQKLALWRAIIR